MKELKPKKGIQNLVSKKVTKFRENEKNTTAKTTASRTSMTPIVSAKNNVEGDISVLLESKEKENQILALELLDKEVIPQKFHIKLFLFLQLPEIDVEVKSKAAEIFENKMPPNIVSEINSITKTTISNLSLFEMEEIELLETITKLKNIFNIEEVYRQIFDFTKDSRQLCGTKYIFDISNDSEWKKEALRKSIGDHGVFYMDGFNTIPKEIESFQNIKDITIRDYESKTLPKEIFTLKSVEKLKIIDSDIEELPAEITNLKQLKSLQIEGCINFHKIPAEIGTLNKLEHIGISCNKTWDRKYVDNTIELPKEMGTLSSLKELYISYYGITEIPEEFGNLKSLFRLRIFLSKGNDLKILPRSLEKIKDLRIQVENSKELKKVYPKLKFD